MITRAVRLLLLALLLWIPARAQGGSDVHGATPLPDSGDPMDPIWSVRPSRGPGGVLSLSTLLEAARAPLVLVIDEAGTPRRVPLLGDFVAMNIAGSYTVTRRFAVGAVLPFFFASGTETGTAGPALGDLQLIAPITLALPPAEGNGVGVSLVPHLRLPTGAEPRWVGDPRVGGGVRLVGGAFLGKVGLTAAVGVDQRSGRVDDVVRPGTLAVADLAFVVRVAEGVALHTEARAASGLGDSAPPAEVMIGARGASKRGFTWTAAVTRGLSGGVSASSWRLFAGVGWRMGTEPEPLVVVQQEVDPVPIVLPPAAPGVVRVRVQEPAGSPVRGAVVTAAGPQAVPDLPVDDQGVADLALGAGEWRIGVGAGGYGRQSRTVTVQSGAPTQEVDVILHPQRGPSGLEIVVSDPAGEPVPNVRVRVDEQPLGLQSQASSFELWGLAPGAHRVHVVADGFQPAVAEVSIGEGLTTLPVRLRREPGGLHIVVLGPEGPVPDAVVRLAGPSRLAPVALGPTGERTIQLRPGTWTVLVQSPSLGLQERRVDLAEDTSTLSRVVFVMQPDEGGSAELRLKVVDGMGMPVEGAEVHIDDKPYGRTANGGTVTLTGLSEGPRRLSVGGPHLAVQDPTEVFLARGVQEQVLTVRWLPGSLRVRVRSPEGEVDDATLRFAGPTARGPEYLGPYGEALLRLDPGRWRLLVASESWGLQQREVVVPEVSTGLIEVEVRLGAFDAGDAGLDLRVVNPLGQPVDGARVTLGGVPLGATSGGVLRLDSVGAGMRLVRIEAEPYAPWEDRLTLSAEAPQVAVVLDWAVGATRVVVEGPEGPVHDAVVRLVGPHRVDAFPVDGEALVALAPGTWQGLMSSPSVGLAEATLQVPEQPGLSTLLFELQREARGVGLVLRVSDPDRLPIVGAQVRLGDKPVGATGGGGAMLAPGVDAGVVQVEVTAPGFETVRASLLLRPGAQERLIELPWVPSTVEVTVSGSDGFVEASVTAEGPAEVPTQQAAGGLATLSLRPGTWQIIARSDALGTQSQQLVVDAGGSYAVGFTLQQARVDVTEEEVVIRDQIFFDFDEASLRPESDQVLREVAATLLGEWRLVRVEVQGHTDSTGGAAYNLDLSERRAKAVVDALVAHGVAPERLTYHGYGHTRPLVEGSGEAAHAINRRVQFEILERAAE